MTTVSPPKNMRTFTTIWIGQLISLFGSGLTSFALGVWIYQQTGRATPFALTVLFGSLPAVLLGPLTGSLADRWNRKKLMLLADTGNALLTLGALLLLSGNHLEIWNIYLIALLGSVFSAFQEPAFAASVVMLVPKKDLQRANGMAQMSNALGNLVPPLLAGLLFGLIGLKGIILIDFVTYFAALGTLILAVIPQPEQTDKNEKHNVMQDARLGWRYLRTNSGLLGMMFYFAWVNFMANFAMVLQGPMVLSTFSSVTLGSIQTAGGLGMLIGSILLSIWGGPKRKIPGIIGFIALSGLGLGFTGLRADPFLIGAGMFAFLFFIPLASGASQAIFQTKVPADLQGRVFAMRSMISRSIMPLAFLSAGPLADMVFEPLMQTGGPMSDTIIGQILGVGAGRGIGLIFVLGSLGLLAASLLAYLNPRIRNIESEIPDALPDQNTGITAGKNIETVELQAKAGQPGEKIPLPVTE
ncbi:MAG: MFS transporter [Chloroflexi bacterium HGW-Chloroflexi-10]|nr:MAG: MFS transporter [Chloroflexi bacterium HGW-Chloroflexi-10]